MKKKILILGISGLTGYKLAKIAYSSFDVYGTFNIRPVNLENCMISQLDLIKIEQLKKLLVEIKPDIVVNTAALHNVDYCEENQEQATKVNVDAMRILFYNAEKLGFKFLHVSTDYVFNGNANRPYRETDNAMPISFYGKTKLEGEKILLDSRHIVVRPSVVYGWTPLELAGTTSSSGKPMNFAMWVLTKLARKEPIKIVTDQFASATLADSLAESILKMAESDKSGLYHVSGLSCESRYDFTIKLAKKFGHNTSLISPTTSTSFVQKAKRPTYSCLDCQKATKEFGLRLLTTEESLNIMRHQVEKEAPHLLAK